MKNVIVNIEVEKVGKKNKKEDIIFAFLYRALHVLIAFICSVNMFYSILY